MNSNVNAESILPLQFGSQTRKADPDLSLLRALPVEPEWLQHHRISPQGDAKCSACAQAEEAHLGIVSRGRSRSGTAAALAEAAVGVSSNLGRAASRRPILAVLPHIYAAPIKHLQAPAIMPGSESHIPPIFRAPSMQEATHVMYR